VTQLECMSTSVRLLGTYLVVTGVAALAWTVSGPMSSTGTSFVLQSLILICVGGLFSRQSSWIAAFLLPRGDPKPAGSVQLEVTLKSFRSAMFFLVASVSALQALRAMAAMIAGAEPRFSHGSLPYELAGYSLVALLAMSGRVWLPGRDGRTLGASVLGERELQDIGLRCMGLWFCILALTRAVHWMARPGWGTGWGVRGSPGSFDWTTPVNALVTGIAGCVLLWAGQFRGSSRTASTQLACETVGILLLLASVRGAAARTRSFVAGDEPWLLLADRLDFPANSGPAIIVTVLLSAGLLYGARRLRRVSRDPLLDSGDGR